MAVLRHARYHSYAIIFDPSCIPALLSPREGILSSHIQREICFDPSKSYLLIGGIGSLGMRLALWMYTASHLTS
jgi:hypothetical protein